MVKVPSGGMEAVDLVVDQEVNVSERAPFCTVFTFGIMTEGVWIAKKFGYVFPFSDAGVGGDGCEIIPYEGVPEAGQVAEEYDEEHEQVLDEWLLQTVEDFCFETLGDICGGLLFVGGIFVVGLVVFHGAISPVRVWEWL